MEMGKALSFAISQRRERGEIGVIAELKPRLADNIDLFRGRSPIEIAHVYQSVGATALSVVTNAVFGGSLNLLQEIAAENPGLPILRKDLIRTERAVRVSRICGASAVLLVLPLLGMDRLLALLDAAREESVEPLVEVNSREEIEWLREHYGGIVAINNADIETNEREGEGISRSLALINRDDPRVWLSASRIGGAGDVRALAEAGFDGILVGTHLLQASDLWGEATRIMAAATTGGCGKGRPE